jgi:hypothetical protein
MSSAFEQLGTEALGFNSEVVAEVKEFTLLPPGKYPFTITNVEKGYTDVATAKIPANTPKAVVTLEADGGDLGKNKVTERLYWIPSMMWKVSNIFIATGLAKPNEKFMANPDLLIGKTGTLELKHRKYEKNDGTEGTANEIAKFYKPDEGFGGF